MSGRIAERILELIYPTRAKCLGCGDEHGCSEPFLCDKCRKRLKPSFVRAVRSEWRMRGLESAAFVYYYGPPVKGLIRAFKFHSVKMLAEGMAQEIAELIRRRCPEAYDMIVPVPLHPARLYERGFNQAEVLAEKLSGLCKIEMRTDVLKRVRKTRQQAKTKLGKREGNLRSAFRAVRDLNGMRILLLDDVVTTGSTLCACAEALKEAGAREVRAVALAGSRACHSRNDRHYRLKKK